MKFLLISFVYFIFAYNACTARFSDLTVERASLLCGTTEKDRWDQLVELTRHNEREVKEKLSPLSDQTPLVFISYIDGKNELLKVSSSYSLGTLYLLSQLNSFHFHLYFNSHIPVELDSNDPRWNKVSLLLHSISLYQPIINSNGIDRPAYIIWVDSDWVPLTEKPDQYMREIISRYPNAHIIASSDTSESSTLINSGAVIVRVSEWSQNFLKKWWSNFNRQLYSDQEQFDLLLAELVQDNGRSQSHSSSTFLDGKVIILDPSAINSDPPAMLKQKSTDKFLHLMGESDGYRALIFSDIFKSVCKFILNDQPLPPQLNGHRENLLKSSLTFYSGSIIDFVRKNNHIILSLSKVKELNNIIHHYISSLIYSDSVSYSSLFNHFSLLDTILNLLGHLKCPQLIDIVILKKDNSENYEENFSDLVFNSIHLLRSLNLCLNLNSYEGNLIYNEKRFQEDHPEYAKLMALSVQHLYFSSFSSSFFNLQFDQSLYKSCFSNDDSKFHKLENFDQFCSNIYKVRKEITNLFSISLVKSSSPAIDFPVLFIKLDNEMARFFDVMVKFSHPQQLQAIVLLIVNHNLSLAQYLLKNFNFHTQKFNFETESVAIEYIYDLFLNIFSLVLPIVLPEDKNTNESLLDAISERNNEVISSQKHLLSYLKRLFITKKTFISSHLLLNPLYLVSIFLNKEGVRLKNQKLLKVSIMCNQLGLKLSESISSSHSFIPLFSNNYELFKSDFINH